MNSFTYLYIPHKFSEDGTLIFDYTEEMQGVLDVKSEFVAAEMAFSIIMEGKKPISKQKDKLYFRIFNVDNKIKYWAGYHLVLKDSIEAVVHPITTREWNKLSYGHPFK